MLLITLIALLLAIPLSSYTTNSHGSYNTISATLFTRITAIAMLYAAALSYSSASVLSLDAGLGLFSGLIHATTITQNMEVFLLITGALILIPWVSRNGNGITNKQFVIAEYPMIILFTTMGATFLLGTADIVSLYLAIELQSFGVYILAAIYRDSESGTAASLKYFLLGALSSALILLGSGIVYGYSGLTNLDSIYELMSVPAVSDASYNHGLFLGLILITTGLLFKVAAAPFHYWAPDVYDGTPTMVTTWLTVMPKISIFVFLLELYRGCSEMVNVNHFVDGIGSVWTSLLLVSAFISLVVGTVGGLGQYRVKRLFAYSTISHVGFLLLALAINSEYSVDAFLFYIVQYSLTNVDAFFVILAFGYLINGTTTSSNTTLRGDTYDIQFISQLSGGFRVNPVLGLSLGICLFSMAGVPPMVGFFAKYTVLYTAINNGYMYMAVVAILASVVSAGYYLRVIRVIHFSDNTIYHNTGTGTLGHVHSYVISTLTLAIVLFAAAPNLIINSTSIIALSMYST